MAIRIITDSTADFTRDEAAQLGIEIVPLKTRFGDEEYIDGVTISPREFYEKLVESDVMPSTSQPSPADSNSARHSPSHMGARAKSGTPHICSNTGRPLQPLT